MSILENSLDKITALCVGSAAIAFGLPPGTLEVSVGAAGLISFVLGRRAKFGPENNRVRGRIQADVLDNYLKLVKGTDGGQDAQDELLAASAALDEALEACMIDRAALAKAAVSPTGFPEQAVVIIMRGLADERPDLFHSDQVSKLSYRYARDVVRAGIIAAVNNAAYYRQLEPELMFEMARSLGALIEKVDSIKVSVELIRDVYSREIDLAKRRLHASESDLIALLTVVLNTRVTRENVGAALEQAYTTLAELRENLQDLRTLGNEIPEITSLLEQADAALAAGAGFSLEKAEESLATADKRLVAIIAGRERDLERDKENRSRILQKRAQLAALRFEFDQAVAFSREKLALLTQALGPDHPEIAYSLYQLIWYLRCNRRADEALPLLYQALEIRLKLPGADEFEIESSLLLLAEHLLEFGREDEAEPYSRQALDIRHRLLGSDDLASVRNLKNLGAILCGQGRTAEAEILLRQALRIRLRHLGAESGLVAESVFDLASILEAEGRAAEAEVLYRQSLEISERAFGPDHYLTTANQERLGSYLAGKERYGEAEAFFRRVLESNERVFGSDHKLSAIGIDNVAHMMRAQGRSGEALKLFRQALKVRERQLGHDHPDTAKSLANLGICLSEYGQTAEAKKLLRRALKVHIHVHGQEHAETIRIRELTQFVTNRTG